MRLTTPPVSYAKAADVWLWACIIFVYIAFMEFGVVKVVNRRFDFDSTTAGVSYKFMFSRRGAPLLNEARFAPVRHCKIFLLPAQFVLTLSG